VKHSFYFLVIGMLIGEYIVEKMLVKTVCRYSDFFKKGPFWRRGVAGQLSMAFFSLLVMGLLGFGEQFGLTLQNTDESLWLILSFGLPFALLFSLIAFLLMRRNRSGELPMPAAEWMKNRSDLIGHVVYCFTMNGVGEELFYRGLIQGYLSVNMIGFMMLGSFPLMFSTILVAILFVLVHLENVRTNDETLAEYLFMLPYRTIIAFILGITFQLASSLLAPMIIHNISNGLLSIAGYVGAKNNRKIK